MTDRERTITLILGTVHGGEAVQEAVEREIGRLIEEAVAAERGALKERFNRLYVKHTEEAKEGCFSHTEVHLATAQAYWNAVKIIEAQSRAGVPPVTPGQEEGASS